MKAYLIKPIAKEITLVDVSNLEDIASLVGFDSIHFDEISGTEDKIYFDEDCFIRGTEGRFKIDSLIPIAGNAVVLSVSGESNELADVKCSLSDLEKRITYL